MTLEYLYDGQIPGDIPNDTWDGDRRMLNKVDWTGDLNLSPFDIDNNGLVELPPAVDPNALDGNRPKQHAYCDEYGNNCENPYTKAWVLMHIVTHEIGHALGGWDHSPFPWCLMHTYAYDWSRQDFISDWYRAKLMVHNVIREIPE
jgi:hypothetical protein